LITPLVEVVTVGEYVSEFEPESVRLCVADPPIALRFAVTAMPVLSGLVAGVTLIVRVVLPPAVRLEGVALALAERLVVGPMLVAEFLGALTGLLLAKSVPLLLPSLV
jgi:hypothetical protein